MILQFRAVYMGFSLWMHDGLASNFGITDVFLLLDRSLAGVVEGYLKDVPQTIPRVYTNGTIPVSTVELRSINGEVLAQIVDLGTPTAARGADSWREV